MLLFNCMIITHDFKNNCYYMHIYEYKNNYFNDVDNKNKNAKLLTYI